MEWYIMLSNCIKRFFFGSFFIFLLGYVVNFVFVVNVSVELWFYDDLNS